MEVHEIRVVPFNILAILLMLVTLQLPPPDENYFPLQHRLFENFYGEQFCCRDVFSLMFKPICSGKTVETPGSILKLATDLMPMLFQFI